MAAGARAPGLAGTTIDACSTLWQKRVHRQAGCGRQRVAGQHRQVQRAAAMSIQSLKRFIDPTDMLHFLFLTSDARKSISG